MSENLLSVFKKELGYVNATNQYVELSIRITEKEHSLDLRNNLQGLAQSVNLISALVVSMLADKFEVILREAENKISALDFYGNDFGIGRLGYIVVPYLLRHKISDVKNNRLKLENGPYPPRKDGGCGWFIVEETVDESENCA